MIYFIAFILTMVAAGMVDNGHYDYAAAFFAGAVVAALSAKWVDQKYPD